MFPALKIGWYWQWTEEEDQFWVLLSGDAESTVTQLRLDDGFQPIHWMHLWTDAIIKGFLLRLCQKFEAGCLYLGSLPGESMSSDNLQSHNTAVTNLWFLQLCVCEREFSVWEYALPSHSHNGNVALALLSWCVTKTSHNGIFEPHFDGFQEPQLLLDSITY